MVGTDAVGVPGIFPNALYIIPPSPELSGCCFGSSVLSEPEVPNADDGIVPKVSEMAWVEAGCSCEPSIVIEGCTEGSFCSEGGAIKSFELPGSAEAAGELVAGSFEDIVAVAAVGGTAGPVSCD